MGFNSGFKGLKHSALQLLITTIDMGNSARLQPLFSSYLRYYLGRRSPALRMAKGHTCYGAPVRGPHVQNICEVTYLTAPSTGKFLWHTHSSQMWPGGWTYTQITNVAGWWAPVM